jgi:ABC-type sugar transport system substrate-binding protein
MKKVLVIFLAVILILTLGFFGCKTAVTKTEETKSAGPVKIGVSYASLDIEFFLLYQKGIQSKAKELGVELVEADSQYDSEKQVNNIESLIAQGVSAIIVHPADETAVVPGVEAANKANIPVFALDRKPTGGKFAYLSAGHEQIGQLQGEFMAKALNGKGDIGLIKGVEGESYVQKLKDNMLKVFEKYPDIKIVFEQNGDWDRAKATELTENLLTAFPDINGIVYQADMMAMGGYEVIKNAGKLDQITMIGGDADLDMLQAIKRGDIEATVNPKPVESGEIALDAAYQMATKGTIDGAKDVDGTPTLFVPVELITKDNVDTTKAWGVIKLED